MTARMVRVTAATGRGLVRTANEDAVLVLGWISQTETPLPVTISARAGAPAVIAVADGLGGHAAGAVASRLALDEIAGLASGWDTAEAVGKGLVAVDAALSDAAAADPRRTGMGTTVTGVVVGPAGVLCFNVGDSRAYLVTDGYPEQISTDDAVLDADGEPSGPVTQALGGGAFRLVPHVLDVPGGDGECRVLLCSDGISGPLDRTELRRACRQEDPDALVRVLLDAAFRVGAPDNLSVVVVDAFRSGPDSP